MYLAPISLKLTYYELVYLSNYFRDSADTLTKESPEKQILLAEYFYFKLKQIADRAVVSPRKKHYTVSFPLSVSLILWRDWTTFRIHHEVQNILSKIDNELANRNLKPNY